MQPTMVEGGIFRSERRAWAAVAAYVVFLYGTLGLAYRVYVSLLERLGEWLPWLMTWMYLPIGVGLLAFMITALPRRAGGYAAFVMICLALVFCLKVLTIPAKRFHFFEYGPLTVLVFDALRFRCYDRYLYVWTLVAVALIGLGDEFIQHLLPDRYFGVAELVINTAAGLFVLSFIAFVMGEENYPWPGRSRRSSQEAGRK